MGGTGPTSLSRGALHRYRREKVGFIFQFYNLLPTLTAVENVELGLDKGKVPRKEMREKGSEYLGLVDLMDRLDYFPQELSAGQHQRVAVARALAREPKLILADEPTGNLDGLREKGVLEVMKSLQEKLGITFFVVTHNQALKSYADRVFLLEGGKLVEETEQVAVAGV